VATVNCAGRFIPLGYELFFAGSSYVQFKDSLVRVPFRILTEEEEKKFRGTWQDVKKEHEKRFKN
jgi:hypothetical protein